MTDPDYGKLMGARLDDLIEHPDTFTPDYADRYRFLREHCGNLSAHGAYAMNQLLGRDASRGYTELPKVPDLQFPAAHVPDLGYQMGWHFIVGTARATDGREFGVQFMPFTASILPAALRDSFGMTAIQNQIMEVHLAISPKGGHHHRGIPTVVSGLAGDIELVEKPFTYRAGETTMSSSNPDGELLPLHIIGRSWDLSGPEPIELGVDFTFTEAKPPFLQGNAGAAPSLAGVGTLYYSIPFMTIGGEGNTLQLGSEVVAIESGEFWLDHQWGTGLVTCNIFAGNPRSDAVRAATALVPSGPGGWDWFMAMFEGNYQLTLATLHGADDPAHFDHTGEDEPTPMEIPVFGSWIDPAGERHTVLGSLVMDAWVRAEHSPDPAVYPVTRIWYPNRWNFTLSDDAPEIMRTFTMSPIVEGGQAGFFAPGVQYSEGAVTLTGPTGIVGHGFAESVGYNLDYAAAVMTIAGLPVTPESLALMDGPRPDFGLKFRAAMHLLRPSARRELDEWKQALTLGP